MRLFPTLALGAFLFVATGCKTATNCCPFNSHTGGASNWIVLFDGKSANGLRGYKQGGFPSMAWAIESGTLKTVPGLDRGDRVDLVTRETFGDFELELEWKVSPGGNSGVIYRVAETEPMTWHTGPEMQVLDDSKHKDGASPLNAAGSLYALIPANANKTLKPVGEFNHAKIVFQNGHVEHWLNGSKVVEYKWGSPEIKALIARSKFSKLPRFMQEPEGRIALQHHGEEVWFRNVRIRRL